MSASIREKLVRLAVFLLLVVVLCILAGTFLSQIPLHHKPLKYLAMALTLAAVTLSYSGAFKPGWVYKSLMDAANGGS